MFSVFIVCSKETKGKFPTKGKETCACVVCGKDFRIPVTGTKREKKKTQKEKIIEAGFNPSPS